MRVCWTHWTAGASRLSAMLANWWSTSRHVDAGKKRNWGILAALIIQFPIQTPATNPRLSSASRLQGS